jgi:hypothetical protein
MIGRLPRQGALLRAVVFLAPVVALLAGTPQGHVPPPWLVVVVATFSLAFAAMPEHHVGSASLVIVVVWWVLDVHGALPLSSVLAAGALLSAHLAGTVAAYGPPALAPDAGVVLLWVRRGLLLWLTAGLTWLVVAAESARVDSAAYWVAGVAGGLVLTVLVTVRFRSAGDRRM